MGVCSWAGILAGVFRLSGTLRKRESIKARRDELKGKNPWQGKDSRDSNAQLCQELDEIGKKCGFGVIVAFLIDTTDDDYARQAAYSSIKNYGELEPGDLVALCKALIFSDTAKVVIRPQYRGWITPEFSRQLIADRIRFLLGVPEIDPQKLALDQESAASKPRAWLRATLIQGMKNDKNGIRSAIYSSLLMLDEN